jgi:hypothetical protein
MTQLEKEAQARNWGALPLTTGFYMTDMIRSVLQFADTDERCIAMSRVVDLLESGSTDETKWRFAINELQGLLTAHPDAHKESGTWYDGDSTILALAVAKEAACHALYMLFPRSYYRGEERGAAYKVLKYTIRALMQKPETAVDALKWVERSINLMQRY